MKASVKTIDNNRYKPSSSPYALNINLTGEVRQFLRISEASQITDALTKNIAICMFEAFSVCNDREILSGEIDDNIFNYIDFEEKKLIKKITLKKYIKIVNGLFKIANNSEIGAFKTLDRNIVVDFDIKIVALANCIGGDGSLEIGNKLLDILCDIVNEELKYRRPNFSSEVSSFLKLSEISSDNLSS